MSILTGYPTFVDSIVGQIAFQKGWVFDLNTRPDSDDVWEVHYTTHAREEFIEIEYRTNPHTGGSYISRVKHRYADSSSFYSSEISSIDDNVKLLGLVTLWMYS